MEVNEERLMNQEEKRLLTFADWPYETEECKCTAVKMAEAGFFHIPSHNEPDLTKCFVCLKELDGWEHGDDPWQEHKRHCPTCPFVLLWKKEADWTVEETLKLEIKRQEIRMRKTMQQEIDKFLSEADVVRQQLKQMSG